MYELYLLVLNSISHDFAALTREILSSTLENKTHIHALACNHRRTGTFGLGVGGGGGAAAFLPEKLKQFSNA